MYRFPNRESVSSLVGNNLVQICCSANTIGLAFDSKISIQVMAESFRVIKAGTSIEVGNPVNRLELFEFLEKNVTDINIRDDKTVMEVLFENGDKIVLEDADHYESYIIGINGKEIIV